MEDLDQQMDPDQLAIRSKLVARKKALLNIYFQTIVATIIICIGLYLFFNPFFGKFLIRYIQLEPAGFFGLLSSLVGMGYLFRLVVISKTTSYDMKFIDVDTIKNRSSDINKDEYNKLLEEIRELRDSKVETNVEELSKLFNDSISQFEQAQKAQVESFSSYFTKIRELIERKAEISDQKASILLDRGISYSKWGIAFFISSIIIWQFMSWFKGFQTQFIYGMISCSLLFVFIEFLSAWFLTQYRQFVDTSTYLIKVKTVVDRYYLIFLALEHMGGDRDANNQHEMSLLNVLGENIKWPDELKAGKGDLNFARNAMESLTELAMAIKSIKNANNTKPDEKRDK